MEPIHEDIAKARTISTSFYNSAEYYQLAKEKIFVPSWQFIGDASLVREAGQCHPFRSPSS